MIKKIKKKILQYGFSDYKISKILTNEKQLYLLRDFREAKRDVQTRKFKITVYSKYSENGKKFLGEYSFTYKPTEDLDKYLGQAIIGCRLIKNRPYSIPEKTSFPKVEIFDERLSNPDSLGERISEIIYTKCARMNGVYLSSAEIYLRSSEIELSTSTGIVANKKKGLIEIDFTLISEKNGKEAEINFHLARRNFDDLKLEDRIDEYQRYVKDMLSVRVPKSDTLRIIFNATDAYNLFLPIIFHASAQTKDMGISRFELGREITPEKIKGDKITLKTDGIIPFGLFTEPFDNEGIPSQVNLIVQNNIFNQYWATKQFADYLKIAPTGSFKNLVIEPGIHSKADCFNENSCQIIQFSAFSPDPLTGDFVAEIRLGYLYSNNRVKIPIKGGSVRGNIFQSLAKIYLSNEKVFEGNYLGPKYIAIDNLTISGD